MKRTKLALLLIALVACHGAAQAVVDPEKYFGDLADFNQLNKNNYPTIWEKIKNGDVTVGYFVGNTRTYSNQDIKMFFASNPTPEQLAEKATELSFSAANVAQAISIGYGAGYDPAAVKRWVAKSKDYALGPDDIIVKLKAGETKRERDGLLEGSWSKDPGNVSYTQWAREWYAAGNGGGDCKVTTAGGILTCSGSNKPLSASMGSPSSLLSPAPSGSSAAANRAMSSTVAPASSGWTGSNRVQLFTPTQKAPSNGVIIKDPLAK